jgi:hypothetical protein
MRTGRYAKAVLTLIALPLCVVASSADAQSGGTQKTVKKAVPLLDEEARDVAHLYWNSVFTKCGASFYTYAGDDYYLDAQGQLQWKWPGGHGTDAPPLQGGYALTRAVTFQEYKGTLLGALTATSFRISPADRLNGLEWQGYVMAGTSVQRDRSIVDVSLGWSPWSSWYDTSSLRVDLKKAHSHWFLVGNNNNDKLITNLRPSIESCSVKSKFLPIE